MRILMTREFHYVNVDFYVDGQNDGEYWVTQEQIGRMLNYRTPERSIKRIHEQFEWHFNHLYQEVELNVRRKGICKVIVYNFDGLLEICSYSGKSRSAEVVNFLWQVKREIEQGLSIGSRELQVYNYGEQPIRIIGIEGESWFVGKDVAEALGYQRPADAIAAHVDEEDKLTRQFTDSGQGRDMTVINESGVYSLIFSSQLPTAKKFKRWVTSEVLPQIRRTGSYSIGKKKILPAQATDTRFYSADELAQELGMSEIEVVALASEHNLMMYGFMRDCEWYFTEEGREKILNAARI